MSLLTALVVAFAAALAGGLYVARDQLRRQSLLVARLQDDVEAARAVARSAEEELATCRALCDQARADAAGAHRRHHEFCAALWSLTARDVERRWRLVMAVADGRPPAGDDLAGQLVRAVTLEAECLREEVGVGTSVTRRAGGAIPSATRADVALVAHAVVRELAIAAAATSDELRVGFEPFSVRLEAQTIPTDPEVRVELERAAGSVAARLEVSPGVAALHWPAVSAADS